MSDIVYLKPKSLFPRSIPSDTLVGAIYYGISEIYGQESINDFIENEEPPILISSAFPYVENNGNKIHFLPKLIVKPGKLSTDLLRKMKRFKKASFIHEEIFNDWINGRVSEGDLIEGIKDKHEVKNGLLVPKNTGLVFNIKTVDRAHNLLNRLTSKSEEFFYASSASFKNSGLFFLINYVNKSQRDKVEGALRYLADRGMGRDISSGSGQFKLEFGKAELIQEPKNGECFTTLSLYCPKDDEIKLLNKSEKMFYELLRREGKSRDGIMKKEILMFNHGSTFPSMDKKFLGKVELVREIPPVIEWGYAYPMKVSKYEM